MNRIGPPIISLSGIILSLLLGMACDQKGAKRPNDSTGGGGGGTTTTSTGADPTAEEPSTTGKGVAASITMSTLAVTTLYTKEAAENTCVPFTITAKDADDKIVADVPVTFEAQNSPGMTDKGSVTPASGVSNAAGELSAVYCSGEDEGRVVIIAKSGELSTNSAKITVTKKPVYHFSYIRSDADPLLTPTDTKDTNANVIFLNLIDSGPQDCTNVYFKLTRSESPVVGEKLIFSTQVDFPKGSKLGKRDAAVLIKTDPITNKKYSYIESISSGAGEFAVPVCAGVSLGTISISATYVDEEDRSYTAKSPVIRITAGLTNYINMSLSFDAMNARTLRAYFNTNSSYQLPVTVQLGARQDGSPITEYPVSIATEIGRVFIENGGTPTADTGSVNFKLQSLHLVDNYPFPVTRFANYPLAQTRCEPQSLASWGAGQSLTEVKYADLRKNWNSTVVYAVRGQEHFHDANRNGIYDVGGDGFWDKNQNGIYDTGDVITYDAGSDGLVDPTGEWFIDLPTPFVDVDEDGVFTASKDILIGDEYQAPNGKRDADALLWKSEIFPISMGASSYGLQRYRIQTANVTNSDSPVTMPWGTAYPIFGLSTINAAALWGGAVTASGATYSSGAFLHDLCGNLLPGGTEVSMSFLALADPLWGPRTPSGHIYVQPGDGYLEPARHLLRDASGGPTATVNFNSSDHSSGSMGYPGVFYVEVPACTNTCTGAVVAANPGVSCDGWTGYARLTIKEPKLDNQGLESGVTIQANLTFGSYESCNCVATALPTSSQGVCSCPTGQSFSNGVCS